MITIILTLMLGLWLGSRRIHEYQVIPRGVSWSCYRLRSREKRRVVLYLNLGHAPTLPLLVTIGWLGIGPFVELMFSEARFFTLCRLTTGSLCVVNRLKAS